MLVCLLLSQGSLKLFSFLLICFSFCCSESMIFIILFFQITCAFYNLVCFSLHYCLLQLMNSSLLVGSFYIFYFLVKTFTVFIYSFSLIQLTFLLPMSWILYLVNYLFLFYCLFFQGVSLALSTKIISSVFSFNLIFSAFMNLGETVNYCSLEGVLFCVRHFYTNCLCSTPLEERLDLTYMQVASFLGVCW